MKKIYTFTIDSDDCLSGRFKDDIRIIASLVYEEIYNYIGDDINPLDVNKNIVYNDICYRCGRVFDSYNGSYYMLISDKYDDGYINYEPFLVGKKTFGITVVDDSFDITIMNSIVQYVLSLLKLNYKIIIEEFSYEAKDINDERFRDDAMNKIYDKFTCGFGKRNKVRRILKNTFSKRIPVIRRFCGSSLIAKYSNVNVESSSSITN